MVEHTRFVVLADVIHSRSIEDRRAFRERLTGVLEDVNDRFVEGIVAPFEPIKGIDEFGAVLSRMSPIPAALEMILDAIHPTRIRVAIATGEIDVGDPEIGVASMDGPAFHRADRLIEEISAEEFYVGVETGASEDALLSSVLNLLVMSREDRTARQIEVIEAYERHGTQTAAAEELDLSHQAVSDTLRRVDYDRHRALRERVTDACEVLYD